MRWNRRMFHTKARSHEGGWLVAPTTLVALRKRVWCLATFVDLVSHCPSHDSLRESQGNSATKPGVTPSAALPRVWSGSAPQPRRGLCRGTETGAPTGFGVIMIPGNRFGTGTSSHQRNPIPFRPCFSHPRRAPNRSKPGTGKYISREDAKARRRDRIRVLGVPASVRDKLLSVHMVFPSGLSGGKGRTANGRQWALMGERPCGRALTEFPRQRCRMG